MTDWEWLLKNGLKPGYQLEVVNFINIVFLQLCHAVMSDGPAFNSERADTDFPLKEG